GGDDIVAAKVDLVRLFQHGRFARGRDLVDSGFVWRLALVQQSPTHSVENIVVEADGLANDERNRLLQRLADALASRHFAESGVAETVLQYHDGPREIRSVRTAEVEQHAVVSGHGYDVHCRDD